MNAAIKALGGSGSAGPLQEHGARGVANARRDKPGGFMSRALLRRHSVLPGFDMALGIALLYLGLIVLLPLSAAFLKTFTLSWDQFVTAVTSPRRYAPSA